MKILIIFSTFIVLAFGGYNGCEQTCQKTFPLHTYPKKEPYYACLRGCRLEMIDQVARDWKKKLAGPEQLCEKDCGTAYPSNIDLKNSCVIGCKSSQSEVPLKATIWKEETKKSGWHVEHYYSFQPLLIIKRYCSGLFNVAVSYIRVDTSVTVKDGEAVSMNIEMKNIPGTKGFSFSGNGADTFIGEGKDVKLTVRTRSRSSWLDCVSFKAGIPKWLLAACLFSSITAFLYLCCCTFLESSNDEKHHKFDDVFTIDVENMAKIPLYPTDQADALPPKYSEKGGIL